MKSEGKPKPMSSQQSHVKSRPQANGEKDVEMDVDEFTIDDLDGF